MTFIYVLLAGFAVFLLIGIAASLVKIAHALNVIAVSYLAWLEEHGIPLTDTPVGEQIAAAIREESKS